MLVYTQCRNDFHNDSKRRKKPTQCTCYKNTTKLHVSVAAAVICSILGLYICLINELTRRKKKPTLKYCLVLHIWNKLAVLVKYRVSGLFVPLHFRSRERKVYRENFRSRGTFVLWNIRSCGTFVPRQQMFPELSPPPRKKYFFNFLYKIFYIFFKIFFLI